MKKIKQLSALLCMLFFLNGCAVALLGVGAGVGIGTYKYIEGRLVRQYPLAYSRAWDATNTALRNLRISITSSLDEGSKGKIDAVRKDGKQVIVTLKNMGQKVTSISVRVGMLGDRLDAEKIHEEILEVSGI